MFDLRKSGIIAAAAFFLSFLIGLVSGSSMPLLLLKPLIFAVLFFIVAVFVGMLVSRFLPELLEENSDFTPGSRIDIMEGDSAEAPGASRAAAGQVFVGAMPDSSEDGLWNISDLASRAAPPQPSGGISASMDKIAEDGYTGDGVSSRQGESWGVGTDVSGSFGSEDALPDLDSMAGAFVSGAQDEETETGDYSVPAPARKPMSGGKAPSWAEDFNAKEIAAGLRTVLNKDKEG